MILTPQVIGAALVGASLFGWFAHEKGESKKAIKPAPGDKAQPKKVAPKPDKVIANENQNV